MTKFLPGLFMAMIVWTTVSFAEPRERAPHPPSQALVNPVEATAASLKQGEAAYRKLCVTCHGLDGTGQTDVRDLLDVPPADFTDDEWTYGGSDGEIFTVTRNGGQNMMEPFAGKLSEQRIWHLVNYIKTFSKKTDGESVALADDAPANPIAYAPASVARGKQYYTRLCITCHGYNGLGDTEMREFLSTHPSDLTNGEWKYGGRDGDIFRVIKSGTPYDMEAFADRMTDDQVWHVVNYLRSMGPKTDHGE